MGHAMAIASPGRCHDCEAQPVAVSFFCMPDSGTPFKSGIWKDNCSPPTSTLGMKELGHAFPEGHMLSTPSRKALY